MEQKKVRIGAVGISGRGSGMLDLLLQVEGVQVPAVCDLVVERAEKGIEIVASHVGELMTIQEMAGVQICIARMNEELVEYWNATCKTPCFKK